MVDDISPITKPAIANSVVNFKFPFPKNTAAAYTIEIRTICSSN